MNEWTDRIGAGFGAVTDEHVAEFDALLVQCSGLAFRMAYSVLRHRQDAEDVAQEAFAKAHARFGQMRDRQRFRRWIVRMVWRMALDHRRQTRRRFARELQHGDFGPSIVREPDRRAESLWEAIDALPEKLRQTIVLASIEGHDLGEVASLLGIPIGTVKSRLFLARQRLKEYLQWMDTPRR